MRIAHACLSAAILVPHDGVYYTKNFERLSIQVEPCLVYGIVRRYLGGGQGVDALPLPLVLVGYVCQVVHGRLL